ERFAEAHAERFPNAAKGIRGFLEDCLTIRGEASRAEEQAGAGPLARPERYPLLLRYRRATLAQVLEAHVEHPAARGARWPPSLRGAVRLRALSRPLVRGPPRGPPRDLRVRRLRGHLARPRCGRPRARDVRVLGARSRGRSRERPARSAELVLDHRADAG